VLTLEHIFATIWRGFAAGTSKPHGFERWLHSQFHPA
jgi:hypothetical protein